jgi:hypothetical protein
MQAWLGQKRFTGTKHKNTNDPAIEKWLSGKRPCPLSLVVIQTR